MNGLLFLRGSRFLVTRDLETDALTGWRAPYTGSEHCTIPAGTILRTTFDVVEPVEQIQYELVDPPAGEAHVAIIFDAAFRRGIGAGTINPERWRKRVYLRRGLGVRAENHAELESLLIPESTRTHPNYDGYSLSVDLIDIGGSIEFLADEGRVWINHDAQLRVAEPVTTRCLRADGIAMYGRIPAGVMLEPHQTIERRREVDGWEMTYEGNTWWQSRDERPDPPDDQWIPAQRVYPSSFLATCAQAFRDQIQADGEWDALLIPTELLGLAIFVVR